MSRVHLFLFCMFAIAAVARAEVSKDDLAKLRTRIGETFWSPPDKRLVRATIYKKGTHASDGNSAASKSDETIGLRYATEKEAGTLGVPHWLPRGSMVKIHTSRGVYSYIAADQGTGVEKRSAAKISGKTEEEKAAPVLDFCAAEQLWPDYVIVEIYYYAGKVEFGDLTVDEQKILFAYAMEYVSKQE